MTRKPDKRTEQLLPYPPNGLDDGDRRGLVRDLGPVVAEDTYIDRPDLGPGTITFVAKGDRVPTHLVDLPRRRAHT
jgi:hypothetical protein